MNDKEVKVLSLEADPEGLGLLKLEYGTEVFEVVYYVDMKDNWHFFYETGKKPEDVDFEYKLMCSL